jgi:DNA-binding response OmpR family regulator
VQFRHIQNRGGGVDESQHKAKVLSCGEINLNLDEAICYKNEQEIILSAKEFLLLKLFMENKGRVLTKKQIYNAVWEEEYLYDGNTVMVHLSRLRGKIKDDPKNPSYLVTIRGIGYKLTAPKSIKTGEINDKK